MNKTKIGIFLSLLLLIGLTSCGEQKSNNKLVLNEILIEIRVIFRTITDCTAHGLKYSINHSVAPTWQLAC